MKKSARYAKNAPRYAPMQYVQRGAVEAQKSGKSAISKQSVMRLAIAIEHYIRIAPQRFGTAMMRVAGDSIGLMLLVDNADATRVANFSLLQAALANHPTLKLAELEHVGTKTMWLITWGATLLPAQMDQTAHDLVAGAEAAPTKSSDYERAHAVWDSIKKSEATLGTFAVLQEFSQPISVKGVVTEMLLFHLPGDWPA